jgi:hypothetical protein
VNIELSENLSGIEKMGVIDDSNSKLVKKNHTTAPLHWWPCERGKALTDIYLLLDVKYHKWQVQNKGHPVSVDKEKERQESMNGGFGDNVRVDTIAKIDRVDVVTVRITWLAHVNHESQT